MIIKFTPALLFVSLILFANAQLIKKFGSCPELNNYYINNVVNLVGPYGLTSSNVYVNTRGPQFIPKDPGTPGGPAGLKLGRPFANPKRIASGNISAIVDEEFTNGADSNDLVAGKDFSTTNVQIKGVDEPDIIKTDGLRVFTLSGNTFSVVQVLNGGKSGKRVGKLVLPDNSYSYEMLIEGNYILVVGNGYDYRRPIYKRFASVPYGSESIFVHQIFVGGSKPKLIQTLNLEGSYVKSREVDGIVRLVMKFNPLDSIWMYYQDRGVTAAQTTKWNREIIQYSKPGNWLPTYRLRKGGRVQNGVYATCEDVYYSSNSFSGFNLLTVVTLPISAKVLSPGSSATVMSNADTVFATKTSMFVTTSEFRYDDVNFNSVRWGANFKTSIHKFNLTDKGAAYVASGSITGSVLNQFAMSEFKGTFFVATTDGAPWWGNRDTTSSKVTAFATDNKNRLLTQIGQVGNLGVDERIFSVRYIADTAYVVTFREVDPLYIIDLSNPRKLKVTGELKIPGFSSYLHPVGKDQLLGVGQEATLTGRTTGAKVSLFDVSDKTSPKEISSWTLSGSYTDAQWDHRAFLYWRKDRVAVMPVSVYSGNNYFTGAIILDVSDSKITERGRITHKNSGLGYTPSITRNAVIGSENLWSMSEEFLQVNNIKKLNNVKAQVKISN